MPKSTKKDQASAWGFSAPIRYKIIRAEHV